MPIMVGAFTENFKVLFFRPVIIPEFVGGIEMFFAG
jgi:hypothetical protein